ncbi:3-keto-disaccharide hydrolase [Granulicella aggregans]|uniref:3-keto-disaccharide hydrolase n=1 Tax=Granulicella aggregans TaxID=474949 RepID=UPI0021DF912B|nr:DUF1080 domain-containing protein [Granulicella aggregans]
MLASKRIRPLQTVLLALLLSGLPVIAQTTPEYTLPPRQAPIVLFDGKDLSKFDTFIKGRGLNSDPTHVFKVENKVIHVSGHEMGYIITKQSFHRFYLRAEFKWGTGTFGERKGQARDSGILYNIQGEDKVWPRSIEFQIKEGETGDFWLTDGAALTGPDGKRVTGPTGAATNIGHIHKGPQKNVVGFRNTEGELEKPYGEWNILEVVVDDNHITQYVNGVLANVGTDPFPTEGKILFQSEGAEVYFRNIQLSPLK